MTRQELLESKEYWTLELQMEFQKIITEFMEKSNLNRKELSEKLGVSKSYISQILNGDFDHRISKLVELSLAIGKVPRIEFYDIDQILKLDDLDLLHEKRYGKIDLNDIESLINTNFISEKKNNENKLVEEHI
jgi:transcriptional regulator with XRE-family HTH domain